MTEGITNAFASDEERAVLALHVVARADGGTPGQFLETLEYIVRLRAWEKLGQSFLEMLESPPPHGAGIKREDAERLIQFSHPHEAQNAEKHAALESMRTEVRKLLNPALRGHGGDRRSEKFQGNNVTLKLRGNAQTYRIQRLRRDHPELAEKVLAGELSAHRAAAMAGFGKKTFDVPYDVTEAAAALRRHFGPDELIRIASALTE